MTVRGDPIAKQPGCVTWPHEIQGLDQYWSRGLGAADGVGEDSLATGGRQCVLLQIQSLIIGGDARSRRSCRQCLITHRGGQVSVR